MNIMPLSSPLSATATQTPAPNRHLHVLDTSSPHQKTLSQAQSNSNTSTVDAGHARSSTRSDTPVGDAYKATIYGTNPPSLPTSSYTIREREQRIDAYANRVKSLVGNIESGSEGERNVKFQNARQFMEPSGYFSGGLLAAGYDPNETFTVTFNTDVGGVSNSLHLSDQTTRTYAAWEIAAGVLEHDKPFRGGPINFNFMHIESKDASKIRDLGALGKKLQGRWESEISSPMRETSGELAQRSGKADAYVLRGALQNFRENRENVEQLSTAAQDAINRTLENNGQVIIPNIYGYPLAGYAFIPFFPYKGDYNHRPNEGVMIDLKNGAISEVTGDNSFADWAKNNRNNLLSSFNASDTQGGKDSHWPAAHYVLDNLIASNAATYPGYQNFLKDQDVHVRQTFNYTNARGSAYRLKYDNLSNIASQFQKQNAKNATWSDQTQVFGAGPQRWKAAEGVWNKTFGYVPVVGSAGNIVFGVHDALYGMTAQDRVGGASGAVLAGLQLAHEIATAGIDAGLGESSVLHPAPQSYGWKYNPQTADFEFVRTPKVSPDSGEVQAPKEGGGTHQSKPPLVEPLVNPLRPSQAGNISGYAVPNGEGLIKDVKPNAKGIYQVKDPLSHEDKWFIRYTDTTGASNVYEIRSDFKLSDNYTQIIAPKTRKPVLTVHTKGNGQWKAVSGDGGIKWPGKRPVSPTPSDAPKTPPKMSDGFVTLDNKKMDGAEKFDEVFRDNNNNTAYETSVSNFEDAGRLKSKLTASWTVQEDNFEVYPSEKAQPNEHSTTDYSPNFIKDLNRDRYTVRIKQPDGYTTLELDGTGSADGETLHKRLKQFEEAIPNPALRSRISEVAHQGSVAPTSVELKMNQLQDHVGFKGKDTHYVITYDPLTNEAHVQFDAQMTLLDLDKDATVIPDMEITAQRSFRITESNVLDGDANPYTIEKKAPFTLSASVITDLK
ncbi:hypothetical protein [Pseudomonas lactucae]|nr:hypothetical protein [Pseudomonas lactucae]